MCGLRFHNVENQSSWFNNSTISYTRNERISRRLTVTVGVMFLWYRNAPFGNTMKNVSEMNVKIVTINT